VKGVEECEGTRPGVQAYGAHQYSLFSHLKMRFKQRFISKYA